jgi:hypothetical protein
MNKVYGRFETVPFWIFVSIFDAFSFTDLPPSITILNKTLNLLCFSFATSHNSVPHFKRIFYLQKMFYEIDDLYPNKLSKIYRKYLQYPTVFTI